MSALPSLGRRIFLVLGALALIYAFLAGLRTVSDPDLPWQLASGRWIVQHHQIPSTDVFSYTATGSPWIYPAGAELIFYGLYKLGGFALLSWLGALTSVGTVAVLLRRGSALTAALAIIALPLIADRTVPRAEMFTVLLFAAYLSLLWENFQTCRARLWLLPLLMLAWVNLHLGFIAGFALIVGFIGLDISELLFGEKRRSPALLRLKRSLPWYAATAVATLVNPWGWKLYDALIRQNRAMATHAHIIAEWASAHWSWHGSIGSFSQQPIQFTLTLVMLVVVVAGLAALIQLQLGAAVLLAGALWATMRYVRMESLTACIVILIGGSVLTVLATQIAARLPNVKLRSAVAITAALAIAVLAVARSYDYASDRLYLASSARTSFGAGLSWWFPKAAADFIEQQNLPANVFNSFNEGGYIVWALGQRYHDYMDGRSIPFGAEGFERERVLLGSPIDSPVWQREAAKYNLNTILVQLDSEEVAYGQLQDLCYSRHWKAVYLDEVSMVLVRVTPATQDLLQRLQFSCPIATLPAAGLDHKRSSFPRWLNAAYVLLALRRTNDALAAANIAHSIDPDSASLHWVRGNILYALSRRGEAEKEWLSALNGANDAAVWAQLANLYAEEGHIPAAIAAWQKNAHLLGDPAQKIPALLQLGHLYVMDGRLRAALRALDEAEHDAPAGMPGSSKGHSLAFDIAQDRAAIWFRLGDTPKAISYMQKAIRLNPDDLEAWSHMAALYQRAGRTADQKIAEERGNALTAAHRTHQN
ncbi:MAG TPA: tetratricopeptide repeat protein [Terriglobales bacterium]